MASPPRKPSKGKASRAGKDMHDRNSEVRKEAAEVLALIQRKSKPKPKGKR
ncbi:MAG: hypothetical protein QOJ15_3669 [Bradyrhizobium sp.]|jgi:hypothetical protein|nr:hypothetical protein [Bradyrhizobium sp.]